MSLADNRAAGMRLTILLVASSCLLAGTSANLTALGVPAALTGPVARGDVETVRGHLDAIRRHTPEILPSYLALARRALAVARAKGQIRPEDASRLDTLLG